MCVNKVLTLLSTFKYNVVIYILGKQGMIDNDKINIIGNYRGCMAV